MFRDNSCTKPFPVFLLDYKFQLYKMIDLHYLLVDRIQDYLFVHLIFILYLLLQTIHREYSAKI